jgi:hypothetical protein
MNRKFRIPILFLNAVFLILSIWITYSIKSHKLDSFSLTQKQYTSAVTKINDSRDLNEAKNQANKYLEMLKDLGAEYDGLAALYLKAMMLIIVITAVNFIWITCTFTKKKGDKANAEPALGP